MKNQKLRLDSKRAGFTLIELLIIVAIIALLASAIFVSISQSRKRARVNGAKTSLKTALPIMISCLDSGGLVSVPDPTNNGGNQICSTVVGANWPILINNYKYVSVNRSNSNVCNFTVSTDGDTAAELACSCVTQACQ